MTDDGNDAGLTPGGPRGGSKSSDDETAVETSAGSDASRIPSLLATVRESGRWRASALVVAALIGIGVAWIHWIGLFVAGALVGLVSATLPRAVLAAFAVGGVVLLVQVLGTPGMAVVEFVSLTPPAYVAIAAAFGAPVWGSLIRGVV